MVINLNPALQGPFEFLIGYINKFEHKDPIFAQIFAAHPFPGKLYQIVKNKMGYIIHVGTRLQEGQPLDKQELQGIYIGQNLVDDIEEKWEYNITVVDRDNMLDLNIDSEDLKKVEVWLDTDHKELRDRFTNTPVQSPPPIEAINNSGMPPDNMSDVANTMASNLNMIFHEDPIMLKSVAAFISYLTHRKALLSLRNYIVNSDSTEAAVAGVLSGIERYDETESPFDLYKTIETCLYEVEKHLK